MGIKIPVDFSDVPERGSVRAPEGDYVLKIKKVKKDNAKSSGNPMLIVGFQFETGPSDIQGKNIIDRHILVKDSLWTLRNMLEAIGYNVPASSMKLDVDSMLIGKKVGATIIDGDEYKGRIKSEIADYLPVSAVGNRVTGDEAEGFLDEDEDDDGMGLLMDDEDMEDSEDGFDWDDDEDDESVESPESVDSPESEDSPEEEDEDDEGFTFADDEEDEDEEDDDEGIELSFDADDVESASGKELKAYVIEAQEAGLDLALGKKPKVSDVRDALIDMLGDLDDEDDFEMEEFSLDDV